MGELSDLINDALGDSEVGEMLGVQAAVLRRFTPGTRGNDVAAGTNPTSVDYPCNAFREGAATRKATFFVAGSGATETRASAPTVSILGGSLPDGVAPLTDDEVDFDGETLTVDGVANDPARGVYICTCNGP